MKQSSYQRRLLAGAAGLVLGAAGVLAFASPASAHFSSVEGTPECDTTTGEWVVNWSVTSNDEADDVETYQLTAASHEPADTELTGPAIGESQPIIDPFSAVQRLPGDATSATLTVDVAWDNGVTESDVSGEVMFHEPCEPGPPENEMPEEVDADFFPVVSCEFLVFFLNNTGEEAGLSFQFTPNQDAVHGHGEGFLDFLDDFLSSEPGTVVEIPEGEVGLNTEGEGVGEIGAGETAGPFGPFGTEEPNNAHVHGFEAAAGLAVQVEIFLGEGEDAELVLDEEFSWDELIGDRECDEGDDGEGGEGGELPETGVSTGAIVGGAAVLLVLGGGLFLVARRRRVTFTA